MYIYILMCFIYMKSRLFWSKIYIIFLYYFVQVILKLFAILKNMLGKQKICTYFSVKIFQFMMKEGTNSGVSMICPKNLNSI